MSQEIEDFVRSAYDRFNEGERLPSADVWHADAVYVNSSDDPDPGTHRRHPTGLDPAGPRRGIALLDNHVQLVDEEF